MSKVSISGNASGTGVFTIQAPNSNTDRVLSLPDEAGTVALQGGAGVGKVLQVVNVTYSTEATTASSTYSDTGLTATITPTSATSKILVIFTHNGCGKQNNDTRLSVKLLRGATSLITSEIIGGYTSSTSASAFGSSSAQYLDSPATTSATTYKTQFSSTQNSSVVIVQWNGATSTMTLMEIAA